VETLLSILLGVAVAWVLAKVIVLISDRSRRSWRSYEDWTCMCLDAKQNYQPAFQPSAGRFIL